MCFLPVIHKYVLTVCGNWYIPNKEKKGLQLVHLSNHKIQNEISCLVKNTNLEL